CYCASLYTGADCSQYRVIIFPRELQLFKEGGSLSSFCLLIFPQTECQNCGELFLHGFHLLRLCLDQCRNDECNSDDHCFANGGLTRTFCNGLGDCVNGQVPTDVYGQEGSQQWHTLAPQWRKPEHFIVDSSRISFSWLLVLFGHSARVRSTRTTRRAC